MTRVALGRWLMSVRPVELAELLKWVLRIGRVECTAMGLVLQVDPASNFGSQLIGAGTYEPEMTDAVLSLLRPGDVFLDVGANEGWFSVLAARAVGKSGRVLAVEPQERLWPVLIRNFLLNDLANAELIPYGIAAQRGVTSLALYPSINTGATSLISEPRRRFFRAQQVPTKSLDELADDHRAPTIRLAKIDVEGYELEVLRGAPKLLARGIDYFLVELHPAQLRRRGQSVEMVNAVLLAAGYVRADRPGINLWRRDASAAVTEG